VNTTTTAAQPLDLDSFQRFNNRGGLMNPESNGLYVRYEDVATRIAQARAAQPLQFDAAWAEYCRDKDFGPGAVFIFAGGFKAGAARLVQAGEAVDERMLHEQWLLDGKIHSALTDEALALVKQDYGQDARQMASTEDYVKDAVSTLITAGYRRASLAPVSAQQGAAVTATTFDDWWATPDATTGHPPAATLDPYSARNAWDAAQLAAYFAKVGVTKAPAAQADALPAFNISRFSDMKQRGVLVLFDRKLSDAELETVRVAICAAPPASTPEAAPIAWLKFWAAQYSMGEGNIGVDEGLEVCNPGEIGMDGKPAFPVYAAPTAGAATTSEDAWDAARYRFIEQHATMHGGGNGFTITCFVGADEEDMGVGIDRAMRATQLEGGK
jgi:hypothetical protein